MFGYVTPLKPELKIREYELFRGYYCGVCMHIKEKFGNIPRFALNYDMAFLGLLLDALHIEEPNIQFKKCMAHHLKNKPMIINNKALEYAAAMNVSLVYYKLVDDVNDDKVREVLNNISLFKTSLGSLENFSPSISIEIFKECYEQYEKQKEKEKLWDFDDLSVSVLYLFKNNPNILNKYKCLFKYVLVDEFQDCDELQIEFLRIINGGNELFAVGDEDQCIYSFRGSKPEYMVNFNKVFLNGEKVFLSTNYRSKKNIIDISKNLISNNFGRNNKEILAFEAEKGIIKFIKPYNEFVQGEEIVKIIKGFIGEKYSTVKYYMESMKKSGVIKREGSSQKGKWIIL